MLIKTHYLDNIPKIIQKKEKKFINEIKSKIISDDNSYKKYEDIINDH